MTRAFARLSASWLSPNHLGFVTFILLFLTLVFSYPAIFHLSTHLICTHPDGWQFVWSIFNFREQILAGKDPYFTDYMFHPLGTSLLLHNYTEFNDVVGLPLSPFFNDIALTNLMGMLATVLSGIGVYILAKELTQSSWSALFAAIAFAFSPFRMNRLTYQMHMALTQWIPFAIWAFLKTAENPRLRYGLLTGLFFSLAYYCNPYFAVYLAMAFVLMLPIGLLVFPNLRHIAFWKYLILAGILASILLTPVALRFYTDYREGAVYPYRDVHKKAATIREYLQRGCMNRYLNNLLGQSHLNSLLGTVTSERGYTDIMPGWVVLTLGLGGILCAIRFRQPKLLMLSFVGFVFFLFSLGTDITISSVTLPMPFYWFRQIPYVNHVRTPERFAIMATLSLTLTAAYLLSLLLRRLTGAAHTLILTGLFIVLLTELAPLPVPMQPMDPPDIFYSLGRTRGDVMLTIPYNLEGPIGSYYLAFQTVHRKNLMDGRISRNPKQLIGYFTHLPITRSLDFLARTGKRNQKQDREVAPLFRRFFGVHYLTLYPPYSQRSHALSYVQTVFPDAQLLADQKGVKVFNLPPISQQSFQFNNTDRGLAFFLLSNWEVDQKGIVCRRNEARLLLPEIKREENADLQLILRSNHPHAKVRCVVADQVIQEIPTNSHEINLSCNIPGNLLLEAHRTVKIQLAYPSGKNGQPQTEPADRPKFELDSIQLHVQ